MRRIVAALVIALGVAACGGTTTIPTTDATPAQSPNPVQAAIKMICAAPAYAECIEDMTTFFEGWTAADLGQLNGQLFGLCDLGSGTGNVVLIDIERQARRECRRAQEYTETEGQAVEVVRVVRFSFP